MITVHHLERSRSNRVLWLLEELGVSYEMKRYPRDPETQLAPPLPNGPPVFSCKGTSGALKSIVFKNWAQLNTDKR